MESNDNYKFVDSLIETLDDILAAPGAFLGPTPKLFEDSRQHSKALYDHTRTLDSDIDQHNSNTNSAQTSKPIKKLFISGFDSEQIWQQMDYTFNTLINETYIGDLSKLLTNTSLAVTLPSESDDEPKNSVTNGLHDSDAESEVDEGSISDDESEVEVESDVSAELELSADEDDEEDNALERDEGDTHHSSQVDDKFFSFKKMEAILDKQDADLLKDPEKFERMPEMYESDESESEEYHYKFSDFFEKKEGKKPRSSKVSFKDSGSTERPPRNPLGDISSDDMEDNMPGESGEVSDEDMELVKALEEETGGREERSGSGGEEYEEGEDREQDDSDEESDAEHLQDVIGRQKNEPAKSEYEKRTEKLRGRISAMEEEALSDKPWQLRGEVTARTRPENSLIQEAVEFDSNVAPVPVITMETTENLEALIIQRIKDKAFDDVERKTRLKEDGEKFRKRIELDHEKSKLSLSQIYEQEYVKLRDKEDEDEDKEDPQEQGIKSMMSSLFSKLDALSSFQYTPKPATKEVKIISHLPSVVVEEVQPSTVTDAARLAPEEVKKPRAEIKERSEMDETDKKRIRRQKKAKHRKLERVKKTAESRVQKINPGLGNKRAEQRSIEAIKQAVVNEGRIIKPSKESVLPDKTYSSSKEFFKALQNEVKLDKSRPHKKGDSKKWVTTKAVEKLKL